MTRFYGHNQELADAATELLTDEHPMTLRQLYYRCISAGHIRNDQREYQRLGSVMTRLREAGAVPRSWIVDHVRSTLKPSSWSGLADFSETIRDCYRKDFWESMPDYVEVIVEKDAVAGTIQPVTAKYDVPLRVCRGYASVSFAGEIADAWDEIDKPIFAYYCGDFDPSGLDIERDLRDKIDRYRSSTSLLLWTRAGVDESDFDLFDLIRLPVKTTDRRAAAFVAEHGSACAELDAIPPASLRQRIESLILSHIDASQWNKLREIEAAEQETINLLTARMAKAKLKLGSDSHRAGA